MIILVFSPKQPLRKHMQDSVSVIDLFMKSNLKTTFWFAEEWLVEKLKGLRESMENSPITSPILKSRQITNGKAAKVAKSVQKKPIIKFEFLVQVALATKPFLWWLHLSLWPFNKKLMLKNITVFWSETMKKSKNSEKHSIWLLNLQRMKKNQW